MIRNLLRSLEIELIKIIGPRMKCFIIQFTFITVADLIDYKLYPFLCLYEHAIILSLRIHETQEHRRIAIKKHKKRKIKRSVQAQKKESLSSSSIIKPLSPLIVSNNFSIQSRKFSIGLTRNSLCENLVRTAKELPSGFEQHDMDIDPFVLKCNMRKVMSLVLAYEE